MADPAQDVVDAAKNLSQGPIDAAQNAAGKVGDMASSAATTVGDAANTAVTSVGDAVTKFGDKAAALLSPGGKPDETKPEDSAFDNFGALTSKQTLGDYGIDQHFTNKMQEQSDNAKKIGFIQNMPAAARAKYLADNGMSQNDIDGIQQSLGADLKEQQGKLGEVSKEAEGVAGEAEKSANKLQPVATALNDLGIGVGVAAGVAAAPEITTGVIAAEIVKTFLQFKTADLATDAADAIVNKVFPNAGWKTHIATGLVSGLLAFKASGSALDKVPWLGDAAKDMPQVQAAIDDNDHMMSEPVGIKLVLKKEDEAAWQEGLKHVEPEVMEGPAGASKTAKDVTPAVAGQTPEGYNKPQEGAHVQTPKEKEMEDTGKGIDEESGKLAEKMGQGVEPRHVINEALTQSNDKLGDNFDYAARDKAALDLMKNPTPKFLDGVRKGVSDELEDEAKVTEQEKNFKMPPENSLEHPKEWASMEEGEAMTWERMFSRDAESRLRTGQPLSPLQAMLTYRSEITPEGAPSASDLNAALRAGGHLSPAEESMAAGLDRAFELVKPSTEDIVFSRGVTQPMEDETHNPGFTSMSLQEGGKYSGYDFTKSEVHGNKYPGSDEGGPRVYKIEVPAGSPVLRVAANEVDQPDKDAEFMLPRGSHFEKVGTDGYTETLRYVPEGTKEKTPGNQNESTPEEQQVAGLQKAGLPVKLVSAQQQAERQMNDQISGKAVRDIGGTVDPETGDVIPAKKQTTGQTAAAARQQLISLRGEVARELDIKENEPIVNQAINRKGNAPLSDEERSSFQDAHDTSIDNVIKLANAHIKAMANNDTAGVAAIGDLFTHESAKLNYLDKALGNTPAGSGSVAQETAKAAVQSSDTLATIAQQQGTPALRAAKAEKIMGWQHYMDPANVAVAAVLYNPKLWVAKAMVDLAWAPYQNAVKGLSYVASLHPQDAFSMWGASAKGALDAVTDMWRYGAKSFTTGERVGEKEMGLLNEPAKAPSTYAQDIDDSHPGMAGQGLQSTFNPSTAAKLKNVAGMVLNTGGRVILGEDQAAKTLASRMAGRTVAMAQAITEANQNGISLLKRGAYLNARTEDLMSLMPKDLFQKMQDETNQFTFTSQNELAARLGRVLDHLTIPGTAYSPEVHLGRLIGSIFLKTPFNLFKQGAMNTPLGAMMPESAGWGAGTDFASKRLAATKMAVGTGLLTALAIHSGEFRLTGTGPLDPTMAKQRKEMGVPDNSIGFVDADGKQYYRSFEGMGPAGTMLGLAANFAESYHSATDENRADYIQHAATAMSRIVDNGPLMHQMGHFLEALNSASRGDFKELTDHLEDAASMPIRPTVLSDIAKIIDPTVKDASTAMNRLLSENPYTRAGVPLKRDHFGYPQYVVPGHELSEIPPTKFETAMYVWNPFHTTALTNPDPVEKECMRVGAKLKDAPEMFIGGAGQPGVLHDSESPKVGVPYSPDPVENARLKDRLQVLAGHEILNSKGLNQHDAMQEMINSDRYQNATRFRQADFLEGIADTFLWKAQRQLQKEDEITHPGDGLKERTRQRFQEQRQEYRGSRTGTASIGAP